jgi:hypothetical protein
LELPQWRPLWWVLLRAAIVAVAIGVVAAYVWPRDARGTAEAVVESLNAGNENAYRSLYCPPGQRAGAPPPKGHLAELRSEVKPKPLRVSVARINEAASGKRPPTALLALADSDYRLLVVMGDNYHDCVLSVRTCVWEPYMHGDGPPPTTAHPNACPYGTP